ncbi:MAG TPA: sulfatase-like hydrolase/transferase [Acidimicrobiia bacterium]|nr:sulfatase-like hydrolase/transferase [Acidimicrobiia bacterium]
MGETGTSIWKRLAVIGGLSAVAFVAPLLDLYGRNPEVFVANRTSVVEIVLFAVGICAIIPALSWAVLAAADAFGGRAPTIAYRSISALLALATGFVVSRQVLPESTLGAVALALGIAAAVYWLSQYMEIVFLVAAGAVPVLFVLFLATSATSRLIWEEPEAAPDSVPVENPANLVMIQLDEMPLASIMETDGTVNEKLFPNFARLAEEGTWYRNALSDSIATTQSVPAILTGRRGEEGKSPTYLEHPDNLFTLLGDSHEMHVIEWVAELCPEEVCPDYAGRAPARFSSLLKDVGVVYGHLTLPVAVRDRLPSIDNSWKGFLGQEDTPEGPGVEIEGLPVPDGEDREDWIDWVQRLINGIDRDTGPTLSYAHLRAPHVPWTTNPSGTHYERPEEYSEVSGVEGDGRWVLDSQPALLGFQRHLFQVGFLDTMIGRMIDHLEATGTWDDTMFVVVADHGASFVPGEHRRWPYEDNRDDLYRVPLFVKYPGQTSGETVDLPAFGIDLLPTIVEVMDVDIDWEFDGTSLLEVDEERPHEPTRWCCNGEGVSTDVRILEAQVERNHEWVPDQSSWLGVAAGGSGSLVGSPLTEIEISDHESFKWSLELGAGLEEVDRSTGMVQTLITGRIETAQPPESDEVLVVLNDVVAGVAQLSMDSPTSGAISGLIAEELVRDGVNDLDLLISDDAGGWLAGSNDDLTLELMAEDGRVLELAAEGNRRVQVDSVELTENGWEVKGWAADVSKKLTPDMFYVFAGDQLLASGPPNTDNKNVVRWFQSENLLRSGFVFEVDEASIPAEVDRLIVVAEFGGEAIADPTTLTR